jgi:hypothetical protein
LLRVTVVAGLAAALAPACSLGQGTGSASGELNVPDCWSGPFDLHPDFFAAVPGASPHNTTTPLNTLQIRIQNGGFYETFSDGILILVDDAGEVRGDPVGNQSRPSLLGQTLVVSLPPSVVPPGVPITPIANPRIVHAALYLDRTCRTQNDALYAMDAVSGVAADGTCAAPEGGGSSSLGCPGPATAVDGGLVDAGAPEAEAGGVSVGAGGAGGVGMSTITFTSLFDGNPDESDAAKRLSEADFELYFADPREMCPGGLGPPPPCRGHLKGHFKFYFERGRPAQPFP